MIAWLTPAHLHPTPGLCCHAKTSCAAAGFSNILLEQLRRDSPCQTERGGKRYTYTHAGAFPV